MTLYLCVAAKLLFKATKVQITNGNTVLQIGSYQTYKEQVSSP